MSSTELTIKLPEALVERAKIEGLPLNDSSIAKMIEAELIRAEARKGLRDAMRDLQGSLTPEEIEAELARAKADRIAGTDMKRE